MFVKLFFTIKLLCLEENQAGPIIGEDKAKDLFNRPQNLKDVKSLAVAKTIIHTFCKQSEAHKEVWGQYEIDEEDKRDLDQDTILQWEDKFDEWEKILSKETRVLDQFIDKHNDLMNQRAGNLEKQYEWITKIKEKLEN